MEAKQFYEQSDINGLHIPELETITLKEVDLYKLMEDYALSRYVPDTMQK